GKVGREAAGGGEDAEEDGGRRQACRAEREVLAHDRSPSWRRQGAKVFTADVHPSLYPAPGRAARTPLPGRGRRGTLAESGTRIAGDSPCPQHRRVRSRSC